MDKETIGTVLSVAKQWWLKVNTKPVRMSALDGAAFPHSPQSTQAPCSPLQRGSSGADPQSRP